MTEHTVSAPPKKDEREAGDGETKDGGGQTAGEPVKERAPASRELWKDGPVWTVRGAASEMDEARRTAASEQTELTEGTFSPPLGGDLTLAGLERAARGGAPGPALERAGRSDPAQAGLEGLYRQTVRGLRPAAPSLPPEQTGRTVRTQEPGSAAALAVDELDRAVRRDSRRYDGGMSIY